MKAIYSRGNILTRSVPFVIQMLNINYVTVAPVAAPVTVSHCGTLTLQCLSRNSKQVITGCSIYFLNLENNVVYLLCV